MHSAIAVFVGRVSPIRRRASLFACRSSSRKSLHVQSFRATDIRPLPWENSSTRNRAAQSFHLTSYRRRYLQPDLIGTAGERSAVAGPISAWRVEIEPRTDDKVTGVVVL